MELSPSASERFSKHMLAKSLLQNGDLGKSLEVLLEADQTHPPYLGIIADISHCYYAQGEFTKWRSWSQRLEREYFAVKDFLQPESQVRTEICIGKFYEEEGRISDAVKTYESILENRVTDEKYRLLVISQLLRVSCAFQLPIQQIGRWYRELMSLESSFLTSFWDFETQHALCCAELMLFDLDTALARMDRCLNSARDVDDRLLIFDLAEIHFYLAEKPDERILNAALAIPTQDPFETAIQGLCRNEEITRSQFTILAREMPITSLMRLQILNFRRFPSSKTPGSLDQLITLIESLSPANQLIWKKRLSFVVKTNQEILEIIIDDKQKTLQFGKTPLDLYRRQTLYKLLVCVLKAGEVSLQQLTEAIWQEAYDANHYNRLRVLVQRANSALGQALGSNDLLKFNQEGVSVHFKQTFRIIDEQG